MRSLIHGIAVSLLLMATAVGSNPALAQVNPQPCSSTAQCPDGTSCQTGLFGLKFCLFEYCNDDADCSRRGALCTQGICRLPGGGGGVVGGSGQSPVGGRCGPRRLGGGVIKSIGCKPGLRCLNGFCESVR